MSSQQDNAVQQQGLASDPEMDALERKYEEAHASAENARQLLEDAKRREANAKAVLYILRSLRPAIEDRV
jgi:hypothetical protein